MKKILLSFLLMITTAVSYGQIGYQVSLFNTATGEPRANETVSCNVTLTNSEGGVIYSGTQSATSNDFGVVSLNVGNASMFENMDWSKLPLFIEISVDGKLIGKSQVLSVPVAEYAKHFGTLTYENVGSKRIISGWDKVYEIEGRTISRRWTEDGASGPVYSGFYYIDGNTIVGYIDRTGNGKETFIGTYVPEIDSIIIK